MMTEKHSEIGTLATLAATDARIETLVTVVLIITQDSGEVTEAGEDIILIMTEGTQEMSAVTPQDAVQEESHIIVSMP